MHRLSHLTLNQKLALLALTLGVGALFVSPTRGGAVSIDPAEMAVIVQKEVDHVSVDDLADWIIQGRADYRLIDLRDEKAYAEYHIPGAELAPITQLAEAPPARNEKIVLYSDGGIHSAQAWFLLKARGNRGVYILLGGLDNWRDSVVFPVLAESPTPFQAERNARLTARAAYFGGAPRAASTAATATEGAPAAPIAGGAPAAPVAMPKIQAPSAPAGVAAAAPRKKKEGC